MNRDSHLAFLRSPSAVLRSTSSSCSRIACFLLWGSGANPPFQPVLELRSTRYRLILNTCCSSTDDCVYSEADDNGKPDYNALLRPALGGSILLFECSVMPCFPLMTISIGQHHNRRTFRTHNELRQMDRLIVHTEKSLKRILVPWLL